MAKELVIDGLEDLAKYTVERLDILEDIQTALGSIQSQLNRIEAQGKDNMALSDQELAAVKTLQDTVDTVSTDVNTALASAQTTSTDLRQQIGELERVRDAALAKDVVDETEITSLNSSIDALKATAAQHQLDVVNALTGITTHISTIDSTVKSVDTSGAPVSPPVTPVDVTPPVAPVDVTPVPAPPVDVTPAPVVPVDVTPVPVTPVVDPLPTPTPASPPDLSTAPVAATPNPAAAPPDLSGTVPVAPAAGNPGDTPVPNDPTVGSQGSGTSPTQSTGAGPAATDPGSNTSTVGGPTTVDPSASPIPTQPVVTP